MLHHACYRKRALLRLFPKKLYSFGKMQAYTQAVHSLTFNTVAYLHGPGTLLYSTWSIPRLRIVNESEPSVVDFTAFHGPNDFLDDC